MRNQTGGTGIYFLRYKCLYVAVDKYPLLGSAYGIRVTILALFIIIQPCNKDDQTTENDKAWGVDMKHYLLPWDHWIPY